MSDGRTLRLAELATRIGGRLVGEDRPIRAVRALEHAGPDDLSFVHSGAHRQEALASRAGALLIPEELMPEELAPEASTSEGSGGESGGFGRPLLVVEKSRPALGRILEILHPRHRPAPGVHETAVIADDAEVDETAHVGPYAVLGAGARVGPRAVIEAHVVVGRDVRIGEDSRIHPGVVLYDATVLGDRVEVHSGAVLGADGFGYATTDGVHHKVPQVGRLVVEDDVEIGANSALDRALLEETRIGAGSKIDNLVQVGHNVRTGKGCILCGQAGIAGSTILGDYVVMGGQTGAADHIRIGTGTRVAAKSAVLGDVDEGMVGGIPAIDLTRYRRQVAATARLPELLRRIRRLEKRLEEATAESDPETEPP